jgi:hypothetical protein
MFDLVKKMVTELQGHPAPETPTVLSDEEYAFRLIAFEEEINEYSDGRAVGDLEEQLDALVDLVVFAMGAAAIQGFDFEAAFRRVMNANLDKRVGVTKRGHANDLMKPAYWRAPYLGDLIDKQTEKKGIIILEGPDGAGKTTLAEFLKKEYGAYVMHSTWSPELEVDMDKYMEITTRMALEISQNQLVVLDRHWLSELVYSDVFRGGHKRGEMYLRHHEALLCDPRLYARLVLCLPDPTIHKEHFAQLKDNREEMYTNIDDVIDAYWAIWDNQFYNYSFKSSSSYLRMFAGLCGLKKAVKYDWMEQGHDMKQFCETYLFGDNQ